MKSREGILDLVRGLCALLVMLGHLRAFIFMDFDALKVPGLMTKGFYFVTGFGHQAVMVFFVLSGYFVGGSVLAGISKGRFGWIRYGTARLTRLWVVLVPALFLTVAVDFLGRCWNPEAYAGVMYDRFMSGPKSGIPAEYDMVAFVGNLFFVQSISVPVFGTNSPLWSLANEFWYYVMFPLIAVAGIQIRWLAVLQIVLFVFMVWWLPSAVLMGGVIWLMGASVWWLLHGLGTNDVVKRERFLWIFRRWQGRLLWGGVFLATLVGSKTGFWFGSDVAVGSAFAIWLFTLAGGRAIPDYLRHCVTGLSEISYTLYVIHFPLLFFVAAVLLRGTQFQPDGEGFLWFGAITIVTLALSGGMWWLFERNTDRVRKWLLRGSA